MCRILHIEDDRWFCARVADRLNESAELFRTTVASTSAQTMRQARLVCEEFDCIILDLSLPDSNPEQTLAWLNDNAHRLPPVIVVTGSMNDRHEADSYAAGAQDFLHRDNLLLYPHDLWHRIRVAMMRHADSTERYKARSRIARIFAAAAVLLLFAGCGGPPASRAARVAYLLTPQTMSVGAFMPVNNFKPESTLLSLSFTYQLRPFIPPVAQPKLK